MMRLSFILLLLCLAGCRGNSGPAVRPNGNFTTYRPPPPGPTIFYERTRPGRIGESGRLAPRPRDLSPEQRNMALALGNIQEIFKTQYAMAELKNRFFRWDLDEEVAGL